MGDIIPFGRHGTPDKSRELQRLELIEFWSNSWADPALDPLQAYDTGMLIGDRCAALIAQNYAASQWLLAELLEIVPNNRRQHGIRSGIVDAVTRALGRAGDPR